jgi:hypothetical protein
MGRVRGARGRWLEAAVAAVVAFVCLLAAGSAHAVRDSIGPIFQQSKWVSTTPAVEPKDGDPKEYAYSRRILLNKAGGGGTEGDKLYEGRDRCQYGDFYLAQALGTRIPACFDIGAHDYTFLDPRLVKGPYPSILTGPRYSSTGNAVDSLKDRPRQTVKALNRIAAWLGDQQDEEGVAPPTALRLQAAAEILANPLIHASTQETIVATILSDERFEEPKVASDPRGREAAVITTPDRGRFGVMEFEKGEKYRGKDTVFTRKLYFDPSTHELLATRVVLEKTDLPRVRAFLREEGAPAVVEERVYARARQVREPDFAQKRIPCKRFDSKGDNCFKIGRGGHYASVG